MMTDKDAYSIASRAAGHVWEHFVGDYSSRNAHDAECHRARGYECVQRIIYDELMLEEQNQKYRAALRKARKAAVLGSEGPAESARGQRSGAGQG